MPARPRNPLYNDFKQDFQEELAKERQAKTNKSGFPAPQSSELENSQAQNQGANLGQKRLSFKESFADLQGQFGQSKSSSTNFAGSDNSSNLTDSNKPKTSADSDTLVDSEDFPSSLANNSSNNLNESFLKKSGEKSPQETSQKFYQDSWPPAVDVFPSEEFEQNLEKSLETRSINTSAREKKNLFKLPLILAFLLVLGLLGGSIFYGNRLFIQAQETVSLCQSDLAQAKKEGLKTEDLNCPEKVEPWQAFSGDFREQRVENQETIEKRRQVQTSELQKITGQITRTQKQLSSLEVTFEPDTFAGERNLSLKIDQAGSYLQGLQRQVEENLPKIDQALEKAEKLIAENEASLDLKGEKEQLERIKNLSKEEKIEKYGELKNLPDQIETKINQEFEQNPNKFLSRLLNLYKTFTPVDFKNLFFETVKNYKKVLPAENNAQITGDPQADARIVQLAEARGYRKQPHADENALVATEGGQRLQPQVRDAFAKLSEAAAKENINLVMVSGYRSVKDQREIFLARLGPISPEEIISGQADYAIEQVLITSSVPNYSRHHTGYTFDIGCNSNELTLFKDTICYQWISANNYLNAKRYGLIPSYPAGAGLQGPDPEEWEYVWVGEDVVKK